MRISFGRLGACIAITIAFAVSARAETAVDRGAYLVNGIGACGNCHSPHDSAGALSGPALSGGKAVIQPAFTAYPPNLTPDRDTGLGDWTEDQIVTALREGRKPDGSILRPPMPIDFYRNLSDRDARAIAAYLRSLAPVKNAVPASEYRRPTPTSYGGPVGAVPDPTDKLAQGRYLAQLGHCMECHTPRDADGRPDTEHRFGAGGRVLQGAFGEITTPNITPDVATGIGGWTDQQLKTALTKGVKPDGGELALPMPWRYFATMRDEDVDALIAYLRTLKPVSAS
ncbi:MAG TPA: c-type cytochrome [Aliidongia sp.]|nr:c-type cytochrome [Aliidongia sp.]